MTEHACDDQDCEQTHDCDEVCEATGFGMHMLEQPDWNERPGFIVKILACIMHPRCIVIQGSEQHYQRHVEGK